MRRGLALPLSVLLAAALAAQLPVAATPGPPEVHGLDAPAEVARWSKFESTATVTPEPANPFDPEQIDVQGHFVGPDGVERRMPGFYYQGYARALVGGREVLTPAGDPVWKVRFAPVLPGPWTWWWTVRTPEGEAATPPRVVQVLPSEAPGFVRAPGPGEDDRYLVFDDGSPFFAVGENVAWYDERGTFAYDSWYGSLAGQAANYARLWMPSWAFGIEWPTPGHAGTGLGDYRNRLGRAWQLDYVIELGERLGIYQMVSLLNHGAYSQFFNSEWGTNPYNAANGGPLDLPGEVFTDPEADELLKRRFRYVVARWGYSTHVLAWELWNEVDLVTPYEPATATVWHRRMAEFLRDADPFDHLVSTSVAVKIGHDATLWEGAGLDFTQFHFYSRPFSDLPLFPNLAHDFSTWSAFMQAAHRRPFLIAEFGVDARGPAETMAGDPAGIGLHDGLWAGALAGTFGTAMTWWWDNYVDPGGFYPMFGSVARFLDGVAWDEEGFVRTASVAASPSRPLVLYGLQGAETALLWVKNDAHQWYSPDWSPVADGQVALTGLAPGPWCGRWWDTWAGAPAGDVSVTPGPVSVVLPVPAFSGDVALRLESC